MVGEAMSPAYQQGRRELWHAMQLAFEASTMSVLLLGRGGIVMHYTRQDVSAVTAVLLNGSYMPR